MASRLPKFGAWEGGQNITVQFDNARRKKTNGQMINPNDPQDNPDMFSQNNGAPPPVPSAQPAKGKRGGIPQFGAWENGDNDNAGYTAVFESVQKTKNSQTPNDEPQMNRDMMHPHPKLVPQPHEPHSKVPTFGGWENGDNTGYTAVFENVKKTKNGPSPTFPNEPQMNRDMQAQAQGRPQPKPAKLEAQQAPRSKVPTFGSWDASEGEFGYTECFDNVPRKNNGRTVTPEPPSNVVAPAVEEGGRAKVPQFGAWEEGDNGGAYTAYFENARKKKSAEPVLDPQLNREINNRVRPQPAVGTKNNVDDPQLRNGSRGSNASANSSFESATKYGKQNPNNQRAGRIQPKPPAARGNQTPERGAAIPTWGVWHSDPSQAKGFTGAFRRAKEERNTPTHTNAPQHYNQHSPPEPKRGCCFGWF